MVRFCVFLKVELIEYVERLDVECERKKEEKPVQQQDYERV